MHVRDHLRNGGTLDELEARFGVVSKRHPAYPNLVLLKYDQIDSPMAEPIVQECRGIILDEAADWRPVCRPFGKFFNLGEPNQHPIDWGTARVQEKLDGSLCSLYHYDGRWQVCTTGSPDAGGSVGDLSFSFAEFFWRTFRALGHGEPTAEDADLCFMFELTAAENRIIVMHAEPRITLLAVRDRTTGAEHDPRAFVDRWPVVRHFDVTSIEALLAALESVDPLQQEGYVVVDAAFVRTKVKHPRYVLLHALLASKSSRRFIELVRTGEHTEVLAYFPDWAPDIGEIVESYEALVAELEADYDRLRAIPVQKDFAAEALRTRCSGALFTLRSGKARSMREYLATVHIDRLASLLGYRDTPS